MNIQTNSHGRAMTLKRRLNRANRSLELRVEPGPLGRWVRAILRKGEEGSALVEIALVTPILMGVLTAICTFAVGFNNQLTLTSAVGAGAQFLQLARTTTTNPCADALTAIEAAAPSLTPGSISLSVTMDGVTPSQSGNTCAGAQTDLVSREPITVTAKYPCALTIMSMGYGTNFISKCQLTATVTEYEY